ncbi:tetratricopeptide repeat protein [Acinetobacter silvestris]|uniref:Sel1 repeat family protein n=1 Tax=Acinetobacter silvestris TaxID=1977882 RepID=A0A1Y3CNY4_9GAMM|nr:SEL1-like repeat protein [Acinetobacter silvestris]OTG67583.1 hypothetical protein B9T28_02880 [Acinetobacter silvestris]
MDITKIIDLLKNTLLTYFKHKDIHHPLYISEAYLYYQRARYYEFLIIPNHFHTDQNKTLFSDSNERNAMWCFLRSATKGHSSAQFKLGQCYLNGQLGLVSNTLKAKEWLKLAANQGHIEAQSELNKISTPQRLC